MRQIGDHAHCEWNGSQQPEVTAYVQKFLVGGGTADTNVNRTDGGYAFDKTTWAPWDVPLLQGSGGAGGTSGAGGAAGSRDSGSDGAPGTAGGVGTDAAVDKRQIMSVTGAVPMTSYSTV